MIQGVIFDMDGVLVDNLAVHMAAFAEFSRRYGYELPQERITALFGRGNDEIIPAILPAEIIERVGMENLSREKEAIYREIYKPVVPVRGLRDFLLSLRRAGIRTSVGSSGPIENVRYVLRECGVEELFDKIVCGDMVTRRKPDPEIFLRAAAELRLDPGRCAVIEDSLSGIEAARRAGCRVVAMATTFKPAYLAERSDNDLIVEDFTQLSPDIVRALSPAE